MKLYTLPNLASRTPSPIRVTPDQLPDLACPNFAGDKDERKTRYHEWINRVETDHCFVSMVAGLQPKLRPSEQNPPTWLYGLIGEYDEPVDLDELHAPHLPREGFLPNYVCHSFSGNARAFWEFEEPIAVPEDKYVQEQWMRKIYARVRADRLFSGFEIEETLNLCRFFEVGHDWDCLHERKLKTSLIMSCLNEAFEDKHFDPSRLGTAVTIEAIREKGAEKFPGALDWSKFDFGQRCHRFWDDTADCPDAVVPKPEGCVVYTPHDGGWMSWGQIFGHDFVRQFEEDNFHKAIQDIYYDVSRQGYWSKHTNVGWAPLGVDPLTRLLTVERGLSKTKGKGENSSEVDRALIAIERHQAVRHVVYKFYDPNQMITWGGQTFLNVSHFKLMQGHPDKNPDGEGMPKLWGWFEGMFGDQLPYWLAHMREFYHNAMTGDLQPTLGTIIVGERDIGKTYLLNRVIEPIFGKGMSGTRYLTGADGITGAMFQHPVIYVDDLVKGGKFNHNDMTERLKNLVSSEAQTVRVMRTDQFESMWHGLLYIIMNRDDYSLSAFPNMDATTRDKFMIFLGHEHKAYIPTKKEIAEELPFFVAYLRDSFHDECIEEDRRFGIKPYHNLELLKEADEASPSAPSLEWLVIFDQEFFAPSSKWTKLGYWQGMATELHNALSTLPTLSETFGSLPRNTRELGRALSALRRRGMAEWVFKMPETDGVTKWRVYRRREDGLYFNACPKLNPHQGWTRKGRKFFNLRTGEEIEEPK